MTSYVQALLSAAMRDRRGITAMEYGILAAAILAVVAIAATTMSGGLSGLFSTVESDL